MIHRIAKLLGRTLRARQRTPKIATLKDLQPIRTAMVAGLTDCQSLSAERLRLKIAAAATAQDLWMLRNDAYQVISQQHNQGIAAERINQLLHAFDGWVEPRRLVRIR